MGLCISDTSGEDWEREKMEARAKAVERFDKNVKSRDSYKPSKEYRSKIDKWRSSSVPKIRIRK